MELRQLRAAVTVAEELHFGRAAERLHVAQPSLSRLIRELETGLGIRIFERTSRQVALTAAGAAFVESAQRTLRMADATRQTAQAAAQGLTGRVALGFVASAAVELLPGLIGAQRERRPLVRLALREMTTPQQAEALRSGEIDVGLTRDHVAVDDLLVAPLFREPLLAVVHAAHPLHARRVIDLRELAESSFVSVPRSGAPRAWRLLEALRGDSASGFEVSQEANQYATVLALVAADVGAAIVPASVRGLRSDDVHYLRLRDGQAFSEVQAVRRQVESRPEARDLHDLMVRTLRGS